MGLVVTEEYVTGVLGPQGVEVPMEKVEQAEAMLCLRVGVILDEEFDVDESLTRNDRHWLRQAIIYQAVWLLDNSDVHARLDANTTLSDGDMVSGPRLDMMVLAPLAAWALRRTSYFDAQWTEIAPHPLVPTAPLSQQDVGFRRVRAL